MSRKLKNIITIFVLIGLFGIGFITSYVAGKSITTSNNSSVITQSSDFSFERPNEKSVGEEKKMEELENENSDLSENGNISEKGKKGPMGPQDDASIGDIEKKSRKDSSMMKNDRKMEDNSEEEPPEIPDDFESFEDGDFPFNESMGFSGNNNVVTATLQKKISIWYYVLFIIDGILLSFVSVSWVLSGFYKKTLKETYQDMDKIVILILASIILTFLVVSLNGFFSYHIFS